MPNWHFLVKFWKWQKAVPILPREAKALQELFCLQPIAFRRKQNSSISSFASWSQIKIHDFTLADQDWMDWWFSQVCGSGLDRIQFHQIRAGLGRKNFTVCSSLTSRFLVIWSWTIAKFPHTSIIPYQDFLQGHILFHLDNPDPVERKRYPIQIQKNPNIHPNWTPKSGSCTPLVLPKKVLRLFSLWRQDGSVVKKKGLFSWEKFL